MYLLAALQFIRQSFLLDFDHFEIFFTDSAFRAHPIIWYIIPAGTGGNAVLRQA